MILLILLLVILGCLGIGVGLKHKDHFSVWMGGLLLLVALVVTTGY